MEQYDVVIIGGGISGLYVGYNLQKKGLRCLVLDKNKHCGGRILSKETEEGVVYECGAGKLFPSHTLMLDLIKELGFKKTDLAKFKKVVEFAEIPEAAKPLRTYLHEILNMLKKEPREKLLQVTLKEWMLANWYPKETVRDNVNYVLLASGYAHVFEYCNAYNGMVYLEKDLLETNLISFLPGLSKIVERLEESYKNLGGSIIKSYKVGGVQGNIVNGKYKGKHIVFAVPPRQLEKIRGLPGKVYSACDSVVGVKLIRVFAHGKLGNIPYTHVGNEVQRTMSRSPGFYQLVYASGKNASFWKDIIKKGRFSATYCSLSGKCKREAIKDIDTHFWAEGIHLWKRGADGEEVWRGLLKLPGNVWVVGEAFCPYQRWMESALITGGQVARLISA